MQKGDEINQRRYTIGDTTFKIVSHVDETTQLTVIDDIQAALSPNQLQILLTRINDPHASAKNSPYTYLFQNALNQYNEYAALELPELKETYEALNDKKSPKANSLLKKALKIQQTKALMNTLREFSQPFVELERWINDQGYHPQKTLTEFQEAFKAFNRSITSLIDKLKTQYQNNAEIRHLIENRLICVF